MKIKIGFSLLSLASLIIPLTVLIMHILKADTLSNIERAFMFAVPSIIILLLSGAFLIEKGETK